MEPPPEPVEVQAEAVFEIPASPLLTAVEETAEIATAEAELIDVQLEPVLEIPASPLLTAVEETAEIATAEAELIDVQLEPVLEIPDPPARVESLEIPLAEAKPIEVQTEPVIKSPNQEIPPQVFRLELNPAVSPTHPVRAEPIIAPAAQAPSGTAVKPEIGAPPALELMEEEPPDCSIARLQAPLLQGRSGRRVDYPPGDFPVLYLENFPISIGFKLLDAVQVESLTGMIPLELASSRPTFCHWQQNDQGLKSDSPFRPDCQYFIEGAEAELELLAERPGEVVVRSGGVLRYLGASAATVEVCKNEERGLRSPRVILRDQAIWVLAWVTKSKGWLNLLGPAQEFQLIRYTPESAGWSGSRFGSFKRAPLWSVAPLGQFCAWLRSTKNSWKLEMIDCTQEAIVGEFTLPPGLSKPTRLLVSDEGHFAVQVGNVAILGEKGSKGYLNVQVPLEQRMELESLGSFGLLCRADGVFQHFPLQQQAWSCQTLTVDKLDEFGHAYPLVIVSREGPVLAYESGWLLLPFHCPGAEPWRVLCRDFQQRHNLKRSVERIDLHDEKRFAHVRKDSIQLSRFRVVYSHGQWSIVSADRFSPT